MFALIFTCGPSNGPMHDLVHSAVLRNGTFIAIIAHGLIGISLVWDKVLLLQPETRNVVSYVFWLGAMSVRPIRLIAVPAHRSQFQSPTSDASPRALEEHISPAKFPAGSWRR